MDSPFIGFDIFRKQSDDPDNPSPESLGLTGQGARLTGNSSRNAANFTDANVYDPATQMGVLPVRSGRTALMEERKKEGKEAYPGFARERKEEFRNMPTPYSDDYFLTRMFEEALNISSSEAAKKVADYRKEQKVKLPSTLPDLSKVLEETLGISSEEAAEKVAEYRKEYEEWTRKTQPEGPLPRAMSEEDIERNLEAEIDEEFLWEPEENFEYSKSMDGFAKALGILINRLKNSG
jgi:hypothetical protein